MVPDRTPQDLSLFVAVGGAGDRLLSNSSGALRDVRVPIVLVTVAYRSDDSFPGFLDSLRAQINCDWRLVVVENRAPEGPSAVLAELVDERITVLRNLQNRGFAKAVNQGLRFAASQGAEFVVLINNDTILDRNFLHDFVAERDRQQALVVAPRIMSLGQDSISWYAGGHFQDGWVFTNVHEIFAPEDMRALRQVEFASGCCLGIMVCVLHEVGLLDETFFVYWEDSDFCMRLKANGIPILYVRDPFLLHAGAASMGGEHSPLHDRLFYGNYIRFLRKHFGMKKSITTILRLMKKDVEDGRSYRRIACVKLPAMLLGLVATILPEPRL